MREPFIYAPSGVEGDLIDLHGEEAVHLTRVLRFQPGDVFIAFDGTGSSRRVELVSYQRDRVKARAIGECQREAALTEIAVAVGSIKGQRMEWAIEKSVELGASRFIPLKTRYSEIDPGEGKFRRWDAIALSACKQSHRSRLIEITPLKSIAEVIAEYDRRVIVFDIIAEDVHALDNLPKSTGSLALIIGPEGGFSREEREQFAQRNTTVMSLGVKPLRTETAVVVALSVIRHQLGEL
jgi:16S rRNA (uracil1498-N3)-methyltransferase